MPAVRRMPRELAVAQSVEDFLVAGLTEAGLVRDVDYRLVDAFDEPPGSLEVTTIAAGLEADDGGTNIEMGTDLKEVTYVLTATVYGADVVRNGVVTGKAYDTGKWVAYAARNAFDDASAVPLKDIRQAAAPVVDYLAIDEVNVVRDDRQEPKPWERGMWILTVPVVDTFYPSTW
jgi:hypothetical protein